MNNFPNWENPNIISRVSPEYLNIISGGIDYQNSNIKKVGGRILKQICKINILAHGTGAENLKRSKTSRNVSYMTILMHARPYNHKHYVVYVYLL